MLPICCGVVPEANWNTSSSDENPFRQLAACPNPAAAA
jgi:hypothetical protein